MKRLGPILLVMAAAVWLLAQEPPLFAPPASEKSWAVVVGVSQYQVLPKEQWLEFAHADAESFTEFLRSGQGLRFLPGHILTVTNEKATRAEILRSVGTWLLRKVKPGDSVYIFLALHGVVEPVGPQDAYLVAYDSTLEDLLTTGISFPQLQDIVQRRLGKAARIFLIADACRAGKLAEAKAFQQKLAGMKGADIYGLLASDADEYSREGTMFGGGHGVFTYNLLRGLQGEADANGNGLVEISEAASFVKQQVAKAADGTQNPQSFGPPVDLALSQVKEERAELGFRTEPRALLATLIVKGPAQTAVSVDGVARGVILDAGALAVDRLPADNHKVMVTTPRGSRVVQDVHVAADPTEVEFNGQALWVRPPRTRGLQVPSGNADLKRFYDALAANRLLEPPGQNALAWIEQMRAAGAPAVQVQDAQEQLASALESEGQQVLLAYLRGEAVPLGAADFERGARFFEAASRLTANPDPLRARQAFCEGRARLYRGDTAGAVTLLQQATALEPRAGYAFNALGIAALQQRQYAEALRQFEAASQHALRWAYPHFNRALTYVAMGQFARAEEAYRRAIELGPRYAYLHYSLAGLYMRINQPARAEQEYRRALELDLDAAAGHNMLGNFYRSRQRDREAELEYRRALEFHGGDIPARLNLARLYRDQRQPRQAETVLREAAGLVKASVVHATLADLYAEMRRGRDAAAQYREAAALAADEASRAALLEKAAKAEKQ